MISVGDRPELRWLPIDRLSIDSRYQRSIEVPASQKLIQHIADDFSWPQFGTLLCFCSSGGWRIIDGQHRWQAALRRGDIDEVPAVVVTEPDAKQHAAFFSDANRHRVPVTTFSLHRARVFANDPMALAVDALANATGIIIPPVAISASRLKSGETCALNTLYRLLPKYGPDIARAAVGAVADAYRTEPGGLRGLYFVAAANVLAAVPSSSTAAEALTKGLRRTSASALLDEIHLRAARTTATLAATAIGVFEKRMAIGTAEIALAPSPVQSLDRPRQKPATVYIRKAPHKRISTHDAETDQAAIARHLATKGVTRGAAAFAAPTQAALSLAEEKRRIAALKITDPIPLKVKFGNA